MSSNNTPANSSLLPRPEVAYVGVTRPPPACARSTANVISEDGLPPPVPPRDMSLAGGVTPPPACGILHNTVSVSSAPIPPHVTSSHFAPHHSITPHSATGEAWDGQTELLTRELEEVRLRAAQMEKTMRWWSDCTANWRDKWSKVRNERNKAREETRSLRNKLEAAAKELAVSKRERCDTTQLQTPEDKERSLSSSKSDPVSENGSLNGDNLLENTRTQKNSVGGSDDAGGHRDRLRYHSDKEDTGVLVSKIASLQGKLEELTRKAQAEEGEKRKCRKSMESMEYELTVVKAKYDDISRLREDTQRQLCEASKREKELLSELELLKKESSKESLELKQKISEFEGGRSEWCQEKCELERRLAESEQATSRLTDKTLDDSHSGSTDRRIHELRKDLERLQTDNANEWAKRELLESQKQTLERENKKLHAEVSSLQEELSRAGREASSALSSDLQLLRQDFSHTSSDLADLRHSHSKVKKLLGDKTTEVEHAGRRAEQYEAEQRRLRARIEELKEQLSAVQDELDLQVNSNRRLQRSHDESQMQVENMTVQLAHLHTRLRRSTSQHALCEEAAANDTFTDDDVSD